MNKSFLCLLLLPFFICCSDDPDVVDPTPTLVGSWELVEVCFSIGTGDCEEKKPDYTESISFTETGRLELARDNEVCGATYTFDGNESLNLVADDNTCNFDKVTYRVSELTESTLTLHPPCREACTQKYRRI